MTHAELASWLEAKLTKIGNMVSEEFAAYLDSRHNVEFRLYANKAYKSGLIWFSDGDIMMWIDTGNWYANAVSGEEVVRRKVASCTICEINAYIANLYYCG
jgi:hypothetical protein